MSFCNRRYLLSNITATTVDVTLVDAQATSIQWSVDYGVGNTTDNNERFTSLSGSLTGLTPNTTYDVVVTTTCDGNVNIFSFRYIPVHNSMCCSGVPYLKTLLPSYLMLVGMKQAFAILRQDLLHLVLGDWRASIRWYISNQFLALC